MKFPFINRVLCFVTAILNFEYAVGPVRGLDPSLRIIQEFVNFTGSSRLPKFSVQL